MEGELKGYLQRFTGNQATTEDLIQATLERLLPRGRGDVPTKPENYIWTTVRSVRIDWQRQQGAALETVPIESIGEELLGEHPDPLQELAQQEEWERTYNIVQALPERCREVFYLCRIEGHQHAVVAERLGIAVGTVKSHLRHASLAIAHALGELSIADE
jgi:RNA polymerase sigma factor (sigma-70 family)